jgi:glycerol-1-phosphatase
LNTHEPRLKTSLGPLTDVYDCAMLDLDGVVYIGAHAVDGVAERLAEARRRGMALAFVTNNAARRPDEVADQLRSLGVDAAAADVVTSAQAAAALVAERVPTGAHVLVVGGDGLVSALRERGLEPTSSADDETAAVVQGFHPSVGWKLLAEGAFAVASGVPWIASNLDDVVPTARGTAPGNGALVDAVATAVGRRPDAVAGKPYRPLFDETLQRTGAARPLVIGDRLDTDIEGAVNCGAESMLVMTGVTSVAGLCLAQEGQRPDYVASTMQGLLIAHRAPERTAPAQWGAGGWQIVVDDAGRVRIESRGPDPDDALRSGAEACWEWLASHAGRSVDTHELEAAVPRPD